jgi:hypothetical protein
MQHRDCVAVVSCSALLVMGNIFAQRSRTVSIKSDEKLPYKAGPLLTNDNHPHKALRMKSPREFIRSFRQRAADCPV